MRFLVSKFAFKCNLYHYNSVHDIVRALREVKVGPGSAAGAPGAPAVDPGKGQGTITGLFGAASGSGGGGSGGGGSGGGGSGGVGTLPGVGEAPTGTECRIKVAEFIGQGDTSKGAGAGAGANAAGAARGGKVGLLHKLSSVDP
jgi:hypothetical protein